MRRLERRIGRLEGRALLGDRGLVAVLVIDEGAYEYQRTEDGFAYAPIEQIPTGAKVYGGVDLERV